LFRRFDWKESRINSIFCSYIQKTDRVTAQFRPKYLQERQSGKPKILRSWSLSTENNSKEIILSKEKLKDIIREISCFTEKCLKRKGIKDSSVTVILFTPYGIFHENSEYLSSPLAKAGLASFVVGWLWDLLRELATVDSDAYLELRDRIINGANRLWEETKI